MEVIHSWSAPRSLSTSLMYSFAQRDDTDVFDEPLYANFVKATGVDRPYKEELLSKMESDGGKVVKDVIYGPGKNKFRYCKHLAKQRLPGLPDDLMRKGKHFILIRNPMDILPSLEKVVPPSFFELGLGELVSIYSDLCQLGKPPLIIAATDLEQDPEGTLRGLCEDLEIPFDDAMLRWEAGPKPIDGLWAPWWYQSVHRSTCFASSRKYPRPFPFSMYDLLERSLPLYNMLRRHVRMTSTILKAPLPPLDIPVPANEKLLAWVGDEILPRESAKVSIFDSVVQGGDSVWEGLRVYDRKVFKLEEHLDRLFDSAKALAFKNVPTREEVKEAIFRTLIRNGMFDNAHIRLSLTRGKKVTSGMSPSFNLYGCTLIGRSNPEAAKQASVAVRATIYLMIGLLFAGVCYLYSVGLQYLPVSTYTLICASQLGFNAVFSFFLNSQKFTPFVINSLVLLTISSVLVFNEESSGTQSVSKVKYAIGFVCTVGASAGYALVLSLTQVCFKKYLKIRTYRTVVDMIFYQQLVATCAIVVGIFASGEWKTYTKEMDEYQLGSFSYIMNLLWTAISWQVFAIGSVGLIFEVSSLFSNAISVLGLPIVPVLAVFVFHDKMSGIKAISMVLAIWGFMSYMFQQYLDDSSTNAQDRNATGATSKAKGSPIEK